MSNEELAVKLNEIILWKACISTYLVGGTINGGLIQPTRDSWCGRIDDKTDQISKQLERIPILEKKFAKATGIAVGAFSVIQLLVVLLDKVVFKK